MKGIYFFFFAILLFSSCEGEILTHRYEQGLNDPANSCAHYVACEFECLDDGWDFEICIDFCGFDDLYAADQQRTSELKICMGDMECDVPCEFCASVITACQGASTGNPCVLVDCGGKNGKCYNGKCQCFGGYSGANCETPP